MPFLGAVTAGFLSLCGADDRVPANFGPVGVTQAFDAEQNPGVCTVTLVSESCAITAGHCLPVIGRIHFGAETFRSDTRTGSKSSLSDFEVDPSFVRALSTQIGNDWAVFRILPHQISGRFPGEIYGYLELELNPQAAVPSQLQTVAYGVSGRFAFDDLMQMQSEGGVLWDSNRILYHDLDTGLGSGGTVLIDQFNGKGYAIHTHGGCNTMGNNKATIIGRVPNLVRAIRDCRSDHLRDAPDFDILGP